MKDTQMNDIEKEELFGKRLMELRSLARDKDKLIEETRVEELFADLNLSRDQLSYVYDYLKKTGIRVIKSGPVKAQAPTDQASKVQGKAKNTGTRESADLQMGRALGLYSKELGRIKGLKKNGRDDIVKQLMLGDSSAREAVLNHFLREVMDIARLYTGQGVTLEDLIGEGNLALYLAVEDLAQGGERALKEGEEKLGLAGRETGIYDRTCTYLARTVMTAMELYVGEENEISDIETLAVRRVEKIAKKASELSELLRRKVSVDELLKECEEGEFTREDILEAIRLTGDGLDVKA